MTKVQRYKVGYYSDEWGSSNTPCLVPADNGYAVKFEDYFKLETELAALKAELALQRAELAKKDAKIEWLKTVPMMYRRMAFNAQLQDENNELRQQVAEKDEVIAEAGEMLAMRDRQLAALKVELREICAAIDDPACDLTLTTVECIKKLKAENEWRAIETAPKDGTVIDLWHEEFGRFPGCSWGHPIHCCGEMGSLCDSDWHSLPEGWVDEYNEPQHLHDFTHWMPLPKPPAMAQGEQG